ncbi:formimidoylglutamase [uncultured Algibacter sp.]|uniref:formimidoylglutamase n=1 Tax=uncultured Algibacter sp. TaxID=298659 RepID=UPI0032171E16
MSAVYKSGENKNWTGRKTNPKLGSQYWYQEIECLDVNDITEKMFPHVGLIGYVCDEGVRRNFGHVGAKHGPKSIRDALAKLPWHINDKTIGDFGDVICIDNDMESCQEVFSKSISSLITQSVFPIGLGGGHDMAYAHFNGIKNAQKNKRIGIINFDAHFDLRPVETESNSGTPFNQIISEYKKENKTVDYFAIGIQKQSNTKQLFDIALQDNVAFVYNDACHVSQVAMDDIKQKLLSIIQTNDYLYITIDLDGFSSAYVKGVSAPSPLGFSPQFVFEMLAFLLKTGKVISCDIAELNPNKDIDGQTVNLASKLIDFIVRHLP